MSEPVNLNNIDDNGYEEGYLADVIRAKMKRDNKRFGQVTTSVITYG